jgi:hypothetical protein
MDGITRTSDPRNKREQLLLAPREQVPDRLALGADVRPGRTDVELRLS